MNGLCSHDRLERALAGLLNADDESTLQLHLDHCELCSAEMERLSGGEQANREVAAMLIPDDLDDALSLREECSTADFVVDHLEPSADPAVLGRLGGYDVLDIIGRGGMGVVLKGFDRELKRFVAIKALAPHLAHSALARKRFSREAQAAAAVVNLHVIAIHQVQPNGQLPFLVMPLLTGESLAHRLKSRGTLELSEILRIGMQAAEGLAAAHGQGLIHRDVKPANILLEKGVERAVLTDFGLARAADDVSMTRWGIIAGTPEYMSPEQASGEPIDGRSDLFSLGCVLYEMATGVSPFRTDSTMATLRRIVDDQPAAMGSLVPELPPWFSYIVERLLSKDPAERFASASEVRQLLEKCLSHVQQPAAIPLPDALVSRTTRSRRISNLPRIGVIAMAGTFSLLLLGTMIWQASDDPARADRGPRDSSPEEKQATIDKVTKLRQSPHPFKLGDPAPPFQVANWTDGKSHNLADFRGKVVVLEFTASWCGPCRASAPIMKRIAEKYGDRVAFVGVTSAGATKEDLKKWLDKDQWPPVVGVDLADKDSDLGKTAKAYGVIGLPNIVVIDPSGNVSHCDELESRTPLGAKEQEKLMSDVTKFLGRKWPPSEGEKLSNEEITSINAKLEEFRTTKYIDEALSSKTPVPAAGAKPAVPAATPRRAAVEPEAKIRVEATGGTVTIKTTPADGRRSVPKK